MAIAFTIAGGTNGEPIDVFGITHLALGTPGASQWCWLGQGTPCHQYTLTNLADSAVYLILGSPQNSDGDGLTDAFEDLVSKTDPNQYDSYGTGFADWWQYVNFGSTIVDPYTPDPSGDGWTYLDDFNNGWTIGSSHTPPPPVILSARFDSTGTNAVITWASGGGPVSTFNVREINLDARPSATTNTLATLSSTATNYTKMGAATGIGSGRRLFFVTASWSTGGSANSALLQLPAGPLDCEPKLVRGPGGVPYLVLDNQPAGLQKLSLYWVNYGADHYLDIPSTNISRGTVPLPLASMGTFSVSDWASSVGFSSRLVATNGEFGAWQPISIPEIPPGDGYTNHDEKLWDSHSLYQFADARLQMKQNLKFLLRAATVHHPFSYSYDAGLSRPETSQDYEYYGFNHFDVDLNFAPMQELRPVQENFLWRNLEFNTADFTSYVYPDQGQGYYYLTDESGSFTISGPTFEYTGTGTESPLPSTLTNAPWIYHDQLLHDPDPSEGVPADSSSLLADLALYQDSDFYVHFSPGARNYFGLPINTILYSGAVGFEALNQGGVTDLQIVYDGAPFPMPAVFDTAEPQLQGLGYYFASQTACLALSTNRYPLYGVLTTPPSSGPAPPIPGSPTFSTSANSPLLITGIGQPITVSGWAKMAITNGYTDRFAYLQQYFDKAYKISDSGTVDTNAANETGVLSPYGEFFPTDAGQIALLTMPDIDTGARGTGVVSVLKLQLDVNHDGIMDLSYSGPDNTSALMPFTFWVNNDCDSNVGGSNPAGQETEAGPILPPRDDTTGRINSWRDLEDYARLWICGVPALTNSGYQVTLAWTNVVSGSPAISLFQSVEADGGTAYLTNTATAASQSGLPYNTNNACFPIASITNGGSVVLPASLFTNTATKHLLFEATSVGSGELLLTVLSGGNVLGQTGAWLDLHDVGDLFERAYATNVTNGNPPSSLTSNFRVIRPQKAHPAGETKQIVVFVHGINNTPEDYEQASRTIFKRLYWSGYQGRFAAFRWPCSYLPPTTLNPFRFNLGEFYAFKSAAALKGYLTSLRSNRPDLAGYDIDLYAHSQGNVVATEAIMQGAPFDNYILSQGAFPAHCYDTNAPFLQKLLDAEANSVNAVQTPFYPVDGGYYGYCATIHGNLVNFYNTNDFALATGITYLDPLDLISIQTNWEENERAQKPEAFLGGPSYVYDSATHVTTGYYTLGTSYTVSDLQEIKALVARSRSRAVGAQTGLSGAITGSVDLKTSLGFGETRDEHSAQFDRPIQTALSYSKAILIQIQPAP